MITIFSYQRSLAFPHFDIYFKFEWMREHFRNPLVTQSNTRLPKDAELSHRFRHIHLSRRSSRSTLTILVSIAFAGNVNEQSGEDNKQREREREREGGINAISSLEFIGDLFLRRLLTVCAAAVAVETRTISNENISQSKSTLNALSSRFSLDVDGGEEDEKNYKINPKTLMVYDAVVSRHYDTFYVAPSISYDAPVHQHAK